VWKYAVFHTDVKPRWRAGATRNAAMKSAAGAASRKGVQRRPPAHRDAGSVTG
jgi:hypothetical protein